MNYLLFRIKRAFLNRYYLFKNRRFSKFVSSINRVEIEITSRCSLNCFNCNRNIHQAPRNDLFTVKQMEKFISESLQLKWRWDYICLIGGEPTLHPDLFKLLTVVKKYKEWRPKCIVEIATNGYSPYVRSVLKKLPPWVTIRNSHKTGRKHRFDSYNVAPVDIPKFQNSNFRKGCRVTQVDGLGLNPYGFYPCGPGASVDRIFHYGIGIKTLSDVNLMSMSKLLDTLCQYCGHFKYNKNEKLVTKQVYSKSWTQALLQFKARDYLMAKY
jgi:hypothetical protein